MTPKEKASKILIDTCLTLIENEDRPLRFALLIVDELTTQSMEIGSLGEGYQCDNDVRFLIEVKEELIRLNEMAKL